MTRCPLPVCAACRLSFVVTLARRRDAVRYRSPVPAVMMAMISEASPAHAQSKPGSCPGAPIDGIFLSDFEQGEIGPDLFRHACLMGLEGLVSKHRESSYRTAALIARSRWRTGSIRPTAACWISLAKQGSVG